MSWTVTDIPDQAGRIAVVTGFCGQAPDGATTTLGRGGSDFSATLLAAATSYSTLRLSEVVAHQSAVDDGVLSSLEAWGVATQPLGFLIYLAVSISMVERGAESSRASAVHLLLLSGARGLQLIALAAVGVAVYLGAGHLPEGISAAPVAQFGGAVFALKTALVLFLMSLMRAAIFRLGIDGFISFGWKLLVPAAALNLLLTAALIAVAG